MSGDNDSSTPYTLSRHRMTLTIPASCFAVVGTACAFVVMALIFTDGEEKYFNFVFYGFPALVVVATNFRQVNGVIMGIAMGIAGLFSVAFFLTARDNFCGPRNQDKPWIKHCRLFAILTYVAAACMLVANIMLCFISTKSRQAWGSPSTVVVTPEAAPGEPDNNNV